MLGIMESNQCTSWSPPMDQSTEQLIQCAQTRLRYLQLEENLRQVLETVISLQTKFELLRVDTVTTLDTVSSIFDGSKSPEATQKMNRQMDVLEKRLASHKQDLQHIYYNNNNQQELEITTEPMEKSDSFLSMSRLSSLSLMSSIFGRSHQGSSSISSYTTIDTTNDQVVSPKQQFLHDDDQISYIEDISSPYFEEEDEENHPFFDLAGKRSFGAGSFCGSVYQDNFDTSEPDNNHNNTTFRSRRRQRRQQHLKHVSSSINYQDINLMRDNELLQHPLSPSPPPYFFESTPQPAAVVDDDDNDMIQEWWNNNDKDRNVLDEAMSFLDGLSEDGDDGGFGEDVYLLLRNPDLCCQPLSDIETTMQALRDKEKLDQQQQCGGVYDVIQLLKPTTWVALAFKYSRRMLYSMTFTGLEWCRFLTVLAAAVMISILKGPDDMKRKKTY